MIKYYPVSAMVPTFWKYLTELISRNIDSFQEINELVSCFYDAVLCPESISVYDEPQQKVKRISSWTLRKIQALSPLLLSHLYRLRCRHPGKMTRSRESLHLRWHQNGTLFLEWAAVFIRCRRLLEDTSFYLALLPLLDTVIKTRGERPRQMRK